MELKDVENLAELAKLELTDEEKQGILKDMESILDYVKVIESVEVPDVEVNYDTQNVWREDVPREGEEYNKSLITGQFPESKNGFLRVKKII